MNTLGFARGQQEELKLMLRLTRPQYFIPVHGEYRHLVHHARLAGRMGMPEERILLVENGQVVEFDGHQARTAGTINSGFEARASSLPNPSSMSCRSTTMGKGLRCMKFS